MTTHSFTEVIREQIDDIEVMLTLCPYPPPWEHLGEELTKELAILRRLARRARRLSRQDSAHRVSG